MVEAKEQRKCRLLRSRASKALDSDVSEGGAPGGEHSRGGEAERGSA